MLKELATLLGPLGFALEAEQPHLSGERYLMTKGKLVLVGVRQHDGTRVIVKASRHASGREEIQREKEIRDLLASVSFANDTLLFPREITSGEWGAYLIWISEFIPQEGVFAAYPIEEQFFLLLKAFEMQEAFHATTGEHLRTVKNALEVVEGSGYLARFEGFRRDNVAARPGNHALDATLSRAHALLAGEKRLIDVHARYLTHADFVPGNFRVHEHQVYLLDFSSVLFGNRYEGWARFQNYAVIHDPDIAPLIEDYVLKNRGKSHALCLRLMRIYKMGFLIAYYARSLSRTSGNLRLLTEKRLTLWHALLEALVDQRPTPTDLIDTYRMERNALRSPEETERQKDFNIPTL